MKGRYPSAVMLTLADPISEERDDELNRWYSEVFVPGVEASPFVQAVRRYESAFRSEPTFRAHPRYLTIVEVSHEDLRETHRSLRELYTVIRSATEPPELRKLDTLYERIGPEFRTERTGTPVRVVYCGLVGCTDTARDAEWNQWYDDKHSPDALVWADTGYRYRALDRTDPVPHQAQPYASLYETSKELDALQAMLADFREQMIASDPIWVNLLAVYYSGLFTPMEA
jgi:hypothetical protein